ncbi:translation initiation factor eIF-2 beta subunit [Thecaphora frezii]
MADTEPLFDPSLKKKKNKKVINLDELEDAPASAPATTSDALADQAPDAEAQQDAELFGGMKKKKNKKKMDLDLLDDAAPVSTPAEGEEEGAGEKAEGDDELNFGEMKKKKKKSKKAAFDLEAFEKELGEGGEDGEAGAIGDDEDLGENPFAQDDGEGAESKDDQPETWHGTDRDYTYQELLGRIFKTLRAQNPALSGEKKKFTMVPPQVARDGSKKTVFANVVDICKRMHRQPDHVIQYLFSELGTLGSVDGSQRLVIRGRFQPKQIENVLRRYITEYVICKTCKRPETLLTKENRIFFVTCEKCGSQRSVSAIKSGFQAQTGKRSKMRAAA